MTDLIYKYLETVEEVEGIWAEFGVYKGRTFKQLVEHGDKVWKFVIGVDSFKGMAKPTKKDGGFYPRGRLNAGGSEELREELTENGYEDGEHYYLYEGYIPEILTELDSIKDYSFCYIDLDQYLPTKQTLDYVFPKLNKGGLILFDDYVSRYNILATQAIKEFVADNPNIKIEEKGIQLISGGCKSQMLVRKI